MHVGQEIRFVPDCWDKLAADSQQLKTEGVQRDVTATVVYVNQEHRYFRAEYRAGGTVQHECFKF